MKAIILAAGRGNRMGALTEERPKCLTPISGEPLLSWQIKALKMAGVKEIGVVRGYKSDKINIDGIFYFENERWNETNMVRSLVCADEWLKNDICIISYSDIIYPSDTIVRLMKSEGDIVVSYNTEWLRIWQARFDDPLEDVETFRIDDMGKLLEIGKIPKHIGDIQGQYMGLIKFTPSGWSEANRVLSSFSAIDCDSMDMTSFLHEIIHAEILVRTISICGRWFEFDSESDIRAYEKISQQMTIL
jgi:L-glutamine-phosphate cytidylyltransferase